MRRLAVLAGLLVMTALPASAATERIPLRFAQAGDVERMLIATPTPPGKGGLGGGLRLQKTFLEGITAITTSARTNELVVDGTADGLAKVREIVRLVDIPARVVRLHIRVFPSAGVPLDPKRFPGTPEGQGKAPAAGKPQGTQAASLLSAEAVADLLKNAPAPLAEARLESENGRLVRVFWPSAPGGEASNALTLMPRVNGDTTVSLLLTTGSEPPPAPGTAAVLLRTGVSSPFGVAVLPKAGVTLVVRVEIRE